MDDLKAAKASLRGLKKYYEENGKVPIYIHTVCAFLPCGFAASVRLSLIDFSQSGTGVLADNAAGMYASEKIYDDSKVEDIESLDPKTQVHREVDIEVVSADKAG